MDTQSIEPLDIGPKYPPPFNTGHLGNPQGLKSCCLACLLKPHDCTKPCKKTKKDSICGSCEDTCLDFMNRSLVLPK